MKKLNFIAIILFVIALLPSCAVITGGSSYNAHLNVDDEFVNIYYKGEMIGSGQGTAVVRRKDADNLTFVLKKDGFQDQQIYYNKASLRGWNIVGSAFIGVIGIAVDGITGAWWKPYAKDSTIEKHDCNNFFYQIHYDSKK